MLWKAWLSQTLSDPLGASVWRCQLELESRVVPQPGHREQISQSAVLLCCPACKPAELGSPHMRLPNCLLDILLLTLEKPAADAENVMPYPGTIAYRRQFLNWSMTLGPSTSEPLPFSGKLLAALFCLRLEHKSLQKKKKSKKKRQDKEIANIWTGQFNDSEGI